MWIKKDTYDLARKVKAQDEEMAQRYVELVCRVKTGGVYRDDSMVVMSPEAYSIMLQENERLHSKIVHEVGLVHLRPEYWDEIRTELRRLEDENKVLSADRDWWRMKAMEYKNREEDNVCSSTTLTIQSVGTGEEARR